MLPPPIDLSFYGLRRLVGLDLMHRCVEVEDRHALRPLALKDRSNLGLKEPQLQGIDGAGAVDGNRDLSDTLSDHSGQTKTCPKMAGA